MFLFERPKRNGNGWQPIYLSPFVTGSLFFFRHRFPFLLSSPKEETRKVPPFRIGGRRPEGLPLWTPAHDKISPFPPSPAPGLTLQAGWNGSPAAGKLLPVPEAFIRSQSFADWQVVAGLEKQIRPRSFHFSHLLCRRLWHVALGPQGRAERSRQRDGRPLIFGGGPGGKTPRSSSTHRKGGDFFGSFLVAQKGT